MPSLKPIIITYEDPLSVLPKYEELLGSKLIPEMGNLTVLEFANKEKEEDPLHRVNVKACGWVGRKDADDQKRFIESYFPMFERKNSKVRLDGDSFNDFICNPHRAVKDYASSIMQGILKFLDLCDVKNGNRRYTITSLLEFLATTDPKNKVDFLNNVMNWALFVAKSDINDDIGNIKTCIYQYITSTLLPLFEKGVTTSADSFFNASGERIQDGHNVEQGNIYHGNSIDIEVATVHSVKGETHISTLYLETFYKRFHESERLAQQFKGVAYSGSDENMLRSLRVAYVGMSRSRYLLCVAVQKDRFEQMDCPELREIWDVEEARKEL